jgi:hypothetical protein
MIVRSFVRILAALAVQRLSASLVDMSSPPAIAFSVGFNNSNCEAHPHYGVQLHEGGWLMVGDSQCWDGSTPGMTRVVFVAVAESNGTLRWSKRLGELGFNYGKGGSQLLDGSIVIGGSKSVRDATAKKAGFDYIEVRALWRLDQHTGALLSETTLPNPGKATGLRDGVMGVEPAGDGTNDAVVTGYVGGEANYDPSTGQYDDEPMFLIFNGVAFAARLSFDAHDRAAKPRVVFSVPLGLNSSFGFVPMQGMRVHHDAANSQLAVSAAACSGPYDDDWNMQFSLLAVDDTTGELVWSKRYPPAGGTGSHPYAMALSPPGDSAPGYVIAGHALGVKPQPIGRLLKARASDGEVVWDRTFIDRDPAFWNLECYGVDATHDGGYIVTCGNGPETIPEHAHWDCHQKTWTAFVYRADHLGKQLWTANVTDAAEQCISDAGEHIVSAKDGGFAVFIDSGTLGKQGTGGNFGLVVSTPETTQSLDNQTSW